MAPIVFVLLVFDRTQVHSDKLHHTSLMEYMSPFSTVHRLVPLLTILKTSYFVLSKSKGIHLTRERKFNTARNTWKESPK